LTTQAARDRVSDLAIAPDARTLAIAYMNGRCECLHLRLDLDGLPRVDGQPIVLNAHRGEATCLRFVGPNALATCGADGLIRVWELTSGGARPLHVSDKPLNAIRFSPDGALLACAGIHEISLVNADSGDVQWRHSRPDQVFNDLAWSSNGSRFAVGEVPSQSVTVFDRSGQTIASISSCADPYDVALSPDGSLVAIIDHAKLQLCRTEDGHAVWTLPLPQPGLSVTFSHDGSILAYGCRYEGVAVIQVKDQRVLRRLACNSGVNCLAFSPDDSLLASGHGDSTIQLWEAQSGQIRATLAGHERNINELEFSPDGRTLLSSAANGDVRAWSVKSGRGYGVVCRRAGAGAGHVDCTFCLARDGRHLAVAYRPPLEDSPDVLVWDLDHPDSTRFPTEASESSIAAPP
jgi:WD40 repeat protein